MAIPSSVAITPSPMSFLAISAFRVAASKCCLSWVPGLSVLQESVGSSHDTSSTHQAPQLLCPSLIGVDKSESAPWAFLLLKGLMGNTRIFAVSHTKSASPASAHEFFQSRHYPLQVNRATKAKVYCLSCATRK